MKIQLFNNEIEDAVKCYLAKEGINIENYSLEITVIAGRSGTENRIEIDMSPIGDDENTKPFIDNNDVENTDISTKPFGS